ASGNLGRGRQKDLVVGVEDEQSLGQSEAGAIAVLYGTSNGISGTGSQFFTQATPGFPGPVSGESGLGTAIAIGNVGGTKANDLVLGENGAEIGGIRSGAVFVLFGTANGITLNGARTITQSTPGVAGDQEADGGFGVSVVVRPLGNGAPADVAIGAPGRTLGAIDNAGGAYVLFGSSNGPTGAGSLAITEATPGIADAPSADELF